MTDATDTTPTQTETTDDPDQQASYLVRCDECDVEVRLTVESAGEWDRFVAGLACPCARITLTDDRLPYDGDPGSIEAALPDPWTVDTEDDVGVASVRHGLPLRPGL